MNDERGSTGRSRVPDHIPTDIIDDHEESARFQVTAERIYSDRRHHRHRWWVRISRPTGSAARLWAFLPPVLAVVSIGGWLAFRPDSPVAFMVASVSTVVATASAFHTLGRWWSRRLKAEV